MTNFEKYEDILLELKSKGRGIALYENKPIACATINCATCELCGDIGIGCEYSLFKWLYEEYAEPTVDWGKVKVDTPILVKHNKDDNWMKRHFAKFENGNVYAWIDGRTRWSAEEIESRNNALPWNYVKLL